MIELDPYVYLEAMLRFEEFLHPFGAKHFLVNDEFANKVVQIVLRQAKIFTSKQSPIYQLLLSMIKRANNKQSLAEISQRDLYNAIYVILKPLVDFSQVNKQQQEELLHWALYSLY